ncbi:hypothetical protein [Luteolibacter arcticus]|uniref:hypothetical protein n=1 Tax=Luteolibacter arcticus TaxID=1581411 RepID=UPI0022234487|nr:hypothetical protein [Luteolibacter arcticus]
MLTTPRRLPALAFRLTTVLAFFLLGLTRSSHAVEPVAPKDLPTSDWSSIRAAYEKGRHAAYRQDDGNLIARNPSQQWQAEFDGRGFTVTPDHGEWTWGLELTGYGERAFLPPPPDLHHEGGKISCRRDESLTEWFINDTRGLEQGWTFQDRPSRPNPAEPLHLHLTTRGNLLPRVTGQGENVSFEAPDRDIALSYGGLKAWDADGKTLSVRFEQAGSKQLRIVVEDQQARYPVTIDPVAQQAYLKASNTNPGDFFGWDVDISGDTVVIGAFDEDSNATGVNGDQANNASNRAGAAYLFVRNGTQWTQQAYLKASNTSAMEQFGAAVAISGDTVVVGASGDDSSATGVNGDETNTGSSNSGAAYVFTRSNGEWTQQAYLKASNTGAGDSFGYDVAIFGDTIVVGAIQEDSMTTGVNGNQADNFAAGAGAAYVFTRSGTTWSQQAYLKASNAGADDIFGWSVAVSDNTIVVGAINEDSNAGGVNGAQTNGTGGTDSGAAYVFVRNGTDWSQQAYLKGPASATRWKLGWSVAVSGDTVVAGAINDWTGAVAVFSRSGTTWTSQGFLNPSNLETVDYFGYSVAVSGDTIVAGARYEDSISTSINGHQANNNSPNSGAAYIFTRSGTTWTQQSYLKASNTGAGDEFGARVAFSGSTIVVGANRESSNATGVNGNQSSDSALEAGAAYVFDLEAPPAPEISITTATGTELVNGGTLSFGPLVEGGITQQIFYIRGGGTADLVLSGSPAAIVTGGSEFSVSTQPVGPLTPSGFTAMALLFRPTSGGLKTAVLSIPNNDLDEGPYVFRLAGTSLSYSFDTDGDGMNDASELNMAALGFNWQTSQVSLVNTFKTNANGAGYYSLNQVQELHAGTPLISKNPATGKFTLSMDWKKSTDLVDFVDFPAPAGSGVSISPAGDIEFEFSAPDPAAFFRLEID